MVTRLLIALTAVVGSHCPWHTPATEWPGDASYSVAISRLDSALDCRSPVTGDGRAQPVLLVHGTGVSREQNWGWSYWPALDRAGFEVCWLALPDASLNDMQISAEYVARAVEVMSRVGDELVDVIGHSQGGLVPRWAIKYFPAGSRVDDYVGFASPNHGALAADTATTERCFEACLQMRSDSAFLAALNSGDETPGTVSYTSIYTARDELVRPVSTARLTGAANILIQSACPGRPVEHALLAGDAVTWELTIDALTHPGPADPARISRLACFKLALPGARADFAGTTPDRSGARYPGREPELAEYGRAPG